MRSRRMALAALAILGTVAFAAPASAVSPNADVHATLVSVHVFEPARGGGKPVPTTANCSNDGATAASEYALTGWVSAGGTAHLNTSTLPGSVAATAASDLQASFDAWSSATNAPGFTVQTDGTVTRQTANRQTDLIFGKAAGNALAVTYTWRWSDGLVESDTVFNRAFTWGDVAETGDGCNENAPYYDLRDIATHEFGHIYGLGHPSSGRYETMYGYGYTGETLKRSPGAGDLNGMSQLY